jgi:hypothetical protein
MTSVTDVIRAIIIANKSQVLRYIFTSVLYDYRTARCGQMSTIKE